MITATITGNGETFTLRAEGGTLEIGGAGGTPIGNLIGDTFRPGALSLYNPRRGGPYDGVDVADEVQVLDALEVLRRRGFAVEITALDVPELAAPAPGYPVVDTRNDAAVMGAIVRGDVPELGDGDLEEGD